MLRFDFHFTADGWRISEVNSDVPGGLIEASGFTRRMGGHFPAVEVPGDPAGCLAAALADRLPRSGCVALVHATAYTDDRQVMVYLGRRLEARGLQCVLASPADLRWQRGHAVVHAAGRTGEINAVIRFFPAEWLPDLPRSCGWQHFFHASCVPLSNPATALLTQSKRFPLAWSQLETPLPAWKSLLPETADPRQINGARHEDWVFKPALGRVGEGVALSGVTRADEWRQTCAAVRRCPADWAAQRRFEAVPLDSPRGPVYPQFGVFTLDGRAVGIYGRLATRPLIDCRSQDVAVLVANDEGSLHPTTAGGPS